MTVTKAKTAYGIELESPDASSRQANATKALGVISQNFPLSMGNATGAAATDGTVFVALVGVQEGDVISNIHVAVETAGTGSGCTLAQYGLYDRLGNRLATTTDGATPRTALESVGIKTTALATAYTVPAGEKGLYVAFINKNSTTVCNLIVSGTTDVVAAGALTGKYQGCGTGGTAQTALPATITIATTSAINFWAAVS